MFSVSNVLFVCHFITTKTTCTNLHFCAGQVVSLGCHIVPSSCSISRIEPRIYDIPASNVAVSIAPNAVALSSWLPHRSRITVRFAVIIVFLHLVSLEEECREDGWRSTTYVSPAPLSNDAALSQCFPHHPHHVWWKPDLSTAIRSHCMPVCTYSIRKQFLWHVNCLNKNLKVV